MEDFQRKETPHEIVVEILSRLPVKSLMRFRCVCKQWLSLTYDEHFINMHMKRHSGFIISYREIVEDQYQQNLVVLEKDGITPTDQIKFEMKPRVNYVFPSCNGLIGFYGGTSIYLCNPGTREKESLPPSTATGIQYDCSYGFGFDPLAKQYKVVKLINRILSPLFWRRPLGPLTDVSQCEVLTVGDESWRNIENVPFRLDGDPVFVQGFLHWRVSHVHRTDELIISFDVGAEKFGVIPHPECYSVKKRNYVRLLGLGGYLCIVDRDLEDRNCINIIHLWILEDYNARTWVKETIVLPYEEIFEFRPKPIMAMINGEILLCKKDMRLISYNLQSKSFRKVDMEGQGWWSHNFTISSHEESLTRISRG